MSQTRIRTKNECHSTIGVPFPQLAAYKESNSASFPTELVTGIHKIRLLEYGDIKKWAEIRPLKFPVL